MSQHGTSLAIEFAVQTAFLALALWVMLKVQKLHWNIPGLLGSAALSSGLDFIPYVGHYISAAVLLLCIAKLSRPDSYTDVLFTVVIAYALMFCMNLFLVGTMMDEMKPLMQVKADSEEPSGDIPSDEILNQTNQATAATAPAVKTGEKTGPAETATNQTTVAQATENAAAVPMTPPDIKTNEVKAPLSAREIVSQFKLKGVSKGAREILAMISTGKTIETIGRGDSIQVQTAKGKVAAHCEKVSEHEVVMNVEGEKVTLQLY
jgi:hypothetical protein